MASPWTVRRSWAHPASWRAPFTSGIFRAASGAFGNTATRLASFIVKGGSNVYGSYSDIDELFPLQADELDPKKRAAILEKMQRLVHEKAINAPIWELAFLNGVGPRGGRVLARQDRRLALYGAVRGHHDQGLVTEASPAPRRCENRSSSAINARAMRYRSLGCDGCFFP
jgi:hypothetical protein